MKSILELNHEEAKEFFLKDESYINMDLPPYIKFDKLIIQLSKLLDKKKEINNLKNTSLSKLEKEPKSYDNINYKILHNKNGKYDWRPLELIHPLLYVNLVHTITEESNWNTILNRFKYIDLSNNIVECMSMPIVSENKKSNKANQILDWWKNIEQKSLELSLEFSYLYHTDIANCYGSIYTHSIPWALHSKSIAKESVKDKKTMKYFIGNEIDTQIQAMSYGQTNGIPQGSVLMDFVAETVLKYADLNLSDSLNKLGIESKDYKILRYRDDYRIFVNSPQVADEIIKILTEILIGLGLKLNSNKTISSNNIIQSSIKKDKLNWVMVKNDKISLQKKLLLIHKFSLDNPNNSILDEELQNIFNIIHKKTTINYSKYFKKFSFSKTNDINILKQVENIKKFYIPLKKKKEKFTKQENVIVLLSIISDIAFLNPKTYAISSAIISQLIQFIEDNGQKKFINKMMNKFSTIPNTGHMQIWMQRAIRKYQKDLEETLYDFKEPICKLVSGEEIKLWNNEWVNEDVKKIFNTNKIIDDEIIKNLPFVIKWDEVLLFGEKSL